MRVKVEWEHRKTISKVVFSDADRIDRTKLAAKLDCTKQYASYLITTGDIPSGAKGEELLKKLRRIPLKSVLATRKMPKHAVKDGDTLLQKSGI